MVNLQAIGHLGKDAIVNQVGSKTVINFTVAHSEKFKNAEGTEINRTLWIDSAYWTDKTKIAQFLKKGTQVHVAGIPDVEHYVTKDGVVQAKMKLRVTNITLLSSKKDDQPTEASTTPAPVEIASEEEPVDDLPF